MKLHVLPPKTGTSKVKMGSSMRLSSMSLLAKISCNNLIILEISREQFFFVGGFWELYVPCLTMYYILSYCTVDWRCCNQTKRSRHRSSPLQIKRPFSSFSQIRHWMASRQKIRVKMQKTGLVREGRAIRYDTAYWYHSGTRTVPLIPDQLAGTLAWLVRNLNA